ncbi:MAG: hypothetical protein LBB61_07435 [Treponema sp.]|jgi:hypothetical protein|nr:hypothetical protein [Treponema sp.]
MKEHSRNLIFAGLLYLVAFIGVVIVSMLGDIGLMFTDDDGLINPSSDTWIFVLTTFFIITASLAVYLIYFFMQRGIAKNPNTKTYLGIFTRIIGTAIASAVSAAVLFLCLNWIADDGEEISILMANTTAAGVILGLIVVINFVSFILFKPRG